jgi:transposase
MTTLTVGVDVSKNTLDAVVDTTKDGTTADLGTSQNNIKGFEQLSKKTEQAAGRVGADSIRVIIEPTGGYEAPLALFAYKRGWEVCMVNSCKVHKWAESQGRRGKTDRLDARLLAEYGVAHETKLHLWKPLPKDIAALDELLKRRDDLEDSLRREKNRLHALEAQDKQDGAIANSIRRHIDWLEKELQNLNDEIDQYVDQNSELKAQEKKLRTVPGVGEKNCLPFLVLMHRWNHITEGKGEKSSLVAYVGFDPVPFRSGTSVYKREVISRKGSPLLRSRFYMSALGGVRGNNPLRDYYQHLLSVGKKKKAALVACARKVLIWVWAVFNSDTVFQANLACSKNS